MADPEKSIDSDTCPTCSGSMVVQKSGVDSEESVCPSRTCPDGVTCDPVSSCCLESIADDGEPRPGVDQAGPACSDCGTPVAFVALSKAQQDCLETLADLLAVDARNLSPSAGPEAWEGLRTLLLRLQVDPEDIPNPTEA